MKYRTALIAAAGMASLALSGCTASSAAVDSWSYDAEAGPTHWGEFAPACRESESSMESPIDIVTATFPSTATAMPLSFSYTSGHFDLHDTGHTIEAEPEQADNSIVYDGTEYVLQQFHVHARSEHLIDGASAAAEIHLVHESTAGAILVVGVLADEGPENTTLAELFDSLPALSHAPVELDRPIDLSGLIPHSSPSAQYMGSLTTPPCTEGVQWNVFLEPITLSPEQLAAFTRIYPENHRPVQPLHGRTISEAPAD